LGAYLLNKVNSGNPILANSTNQHAGLKLKDNRLNANSWEYLTIVINKEWEN